MFMRLPLKDCVEKGVIDLFEVILAVERSAFHRYFCDVCQRCVIGGKAPEIVFLCSNRIKQTRPLAWQQKKKRERWKPPIRAGRAM
jgi:hypothetical protein